MIRTRTNVCFWHKADILIALANVRFWGQSGHGPDTWGMSASDPKHPFGATSHSRLIYTYGMRSTASWLTFIGKSSRRHGQRPSISSTNVRLRKVRTTTSQSRRPRLVKVSSIAMVFTMSAATRTSGQAATIDQSVFYIDRNAALYFVDVQRQKSTRRRSSLRKIPLRSRWTTRISVADARNLGRGIGNLEAAK